MGILLIGLAILIGFALFGLFMDESIAGFWIGGLFGLFVGGVTMLIVGVVLDLTMGRETQSIEVKNMTINADAKFVVTPVEGKPFIIDEDASFDAEDVKMNNNFREGIAVCEYSKKGFWTPMGYNKYIRCEINPNTLEVG